MTRLKAVASKQQAHGARVKRAASIAAAAKLIAWLHKNTSPKKRVVATESLTVRTGSGKRKRTILHEKVTVVRRRRRKQTRPRRAYFS